MGRFDVVLAVQRLCVGVGDRGQSGRQHLEGEDEPGKLPEPFASVTAVPSHLLAFLDEHQLALLSTAAGRRCSFTVPAGLD
jgi:hypothetical protein